MMTATQMEKAPREVDDRREIEGRPFGADVARHGVAYRVWAPDCNRVEVQVQPASGSGERLLTLRSDEHGQWQGSDAEGRAGDRYKFRLDGGDAFPDPGSRGQVESVHDWSVVVDSEQYQWQDAGWSRPAFRDLVIYEVHVGTFTREGTFLAAIGKLGYLRELGVSAIEIMPIGDFPGSRNWGYDGVLIYAPARAYGSPDDLRALVDAAHQHGLAVILDVVYNHFGPDGNYLSKYTSAFFTDEHHTPWGSAVNFDGPGSEFVRRFFLENPIYWMHEFHIDGFRLDATHAIIDTSEPHILAEIAAEVHARGGYVIAEDERNEAKLLQDPQEGGYGFDGVWADDFHHVARVSQTGQRESYFRDFEGTLEQLVDTLQHGWHYRGQFSQARGEARGTECRALPPSKFIHCISNHDQAGNRAFGERINASVDPEGYRALSMLLCLTPYTPMLFMGQDWAASTPFLYFVEHNDELGPLITEGRRREFSDFPEFSDHAALERIPDPQASQTFETSKLNWQEREQPEHAEILTLYSECLRLRNAVTAFRPGERQTWDVQQLSSGIGGIRIDDGRTSYLLLINLTGAHSGSLAEESFALLPAGERWEVVFSSNEARFGGRGSASFDPEAQSCSFTEAEVVLLRNSAEPTDHNGANKFLPSSAAGDSGATRLVL
jgi:maltooligosyltrehalose trehalohydrolase